MVMRFDPDAPMHDRYRVEHGFLGPAAGIEAMTISRIVNAFFLWEFNSCEMLIKDGVVYPIDYANACPDVSITSLHYYFPWAIKALLKWTVFCLVSGRRPGVDTDTRSYFDIADAADLDYGSKLAKYRELADSYLAVDAYREFCDHQLADLDARVLDWTASQDFDRLLVDTVTAVYPPAERDRFIEHFRGLTGLWVTEEIARLSGA
jgi:hypothetical protein